jgi:PAS domain S-box-containing protein
MFFVRPDAKVFEELFLRSLDPVAITGRNGAVLHVNPAWQRVLGWSLEELTAASLLHFVHFNDIPSMLVQRAELEEHRANEAHGELRFLHKDGTFRTLEYNATRFDGYEFAVYRDITTRIRTELAALDALDDATAVLDSLPTPVVVLDRNAVVLRANTDAERKLGIAMGDRLDMSVTSIVEREDRANVAVALEYLFLNEDTADFTFRVNDRVGRMHVLTARGRIVRRHGETPTCAVLSMDETTERRENPRASSRFVLKEVVRECVDSVTPLALGLHIDIFLRHIPDVELCADPRRVKMVMLDLLSNAIAYSRRNGVVTVVSQVRDERVRVSMSDTGSGVSPLLLEQLFTPVAPRAPEAPVLSDVGLELSRSRSLIESVGGAVGVDTTIGDGLTFWLDMPLSANAS